MKKSDLKQLIKPLVKECIHEVLLEEGLLSNVVAEVAKGMQQNVIVEARQKKPDALFNEQQQLSRKASESRTKLQEHRNSLMNSVGKGAYNGVDLFEGTTPTSNHEFQQGDTDLGNPQDAGVDISSILGKSSAIWQALKQEQRWQRPYM